MLGVLEEEAVEGGGREVECDQVVGGADILSDVSSSVELPGLIPMRSLYQVPSRVAAAAQSVNGRVGDAEGVTRRQERSIRRRWSCFVRAPFWVEMCFSTCDLHRELDPESFLLLFTPLNLLHTSSSLAHRTPACLDKSHNPHNGLRTNAVNELPHVCVCVCGSVQVMNNKCQRKPNAHFLPARLLMLAFALSNCFCSLLSTCNVDMILSIFFL